MTDEFKLKEEVFENSLRIAAEKHRRLWIKVELDGGEEGNLWIENGRILHTVVGRLPGIEAFRTIVSSRYVKILSFSG